MVFEQEIIRLKHPHLYKVTDVPPHGEMLRPSALAARIQEQLPDSLHLSALQLPSAPDETCQAEFMNRERTTLSVNPYTGDVLGWVEGSDFFRTVRQLHRWLLDAPAQRGEMSVGKAIVGISTLLMVVILLSGLVIWLPRSYKALKSRLTLSCHKGWRRFVHDSHVALGFYATLLLLVMALTGLTWSFSWYRNAAYTLFGADMKAAPSRGHAGGRPNNKMEKDKGRMFNYVVWDDVFDELRMLYPNYKTIKLGQGTAQIQPDRKATMRRTDTVTFHPASGEIVHIERYQDQPKSQSLRAWFYAFHTGSWGGIWTKILYFLAALIGASLPLSGYYLWIKRKWGKRPLQQ